LLYLLYFTTKIADLSLLTCSTSSTAKIFITMTRQFIMPTGNWYIFLYYPKNQHGKNFVETPEKLESLDNRRYLFYPCNCWNSSTTCLT
jgi:hypothetical protein